VTVVAQLVIDNYYQIVYHYFNRITDKSLVNYKIIIMSKIHNITRVPYIKRERATPVIA